jgi:hypothetical protein
MAHLSLGLRESEDPALDASHGPSLLLGGVQCAWHLLRNCRGKDTCKVRPGWGQLWNREDGTSSGISQSLLDYRPKLPALRTVRVCHAQIHECVTNSQIPLRCLVHPVIHQHACAERTHSHGSAKCHRGSSANASRRHVHPGVRLPAPAASPAASDTTSSAAPGHSRDLNATGSCPETASRGGSSRHGGLQTVHGSLAAQSLPGHLGHSCLERGGHGVHTRAKRRHLLIQGRDAPIHVAEGDGLESVGSSRCLIELICQRPEASSDPAEAQIRECSCPSGRLSERLLDLLESLANADEGGGGLVVDDEGRADPATKSSAKRAGHATPGRGLA